MRRRQTRGQTHRHDRQAEIQIYRHTDRQADRHTAKHIYRHTNTQNADTYNQTDIQT